MKKMKKRIVICEDDKNIVEIISYILEGKNYEVIPLFDCNDIEEIKKKNPNLLLLDLWMPGLDGPSIAAQLKNGNGKSSVPIVVVSANNEIEKVSEQIGADGFLRKPFDIEELEKIVEKYIN